MRYVTRLGMGRASVRTVAPPATKQKRGEAWRAETLLQEARAREHNGIETSLNAG